MYVLDTNIIIDYIKGKNEVVNLVDNLEEPHITTTTLAELSYGVYKSKNPQKHLQELMILLNSLKLIGVGIPTSFKFGEIKAHLKNLGKPSSDFDVLISSSCLVHDYILVTDNKKHFENIPGLKLMSV
jgi:predicted nucleic acid-binding protein